MIIFFKLVLDGKYSNYPCAPWHGIIWKLKKHAIILFFVCMTQRGSHLQRGLLINQVDVWDLQLIRILTMCNESRKWTALSLIKGKGNSWTLKHLSVHKDVLVSFFIKIQHHLLWVVPTVTYWFCLVRGGLASEMQSN